MMLKIQLCITGINYILKRIKIENCDFKLLYFTTLYSIIDQINAVLASIRDLLLENIKNILIHQDYFAG